MAKGIERLEINSVLPFSSLILMLFTFKKRTSLSFIHPSVHSFNAKVFTYTWRNGRDIYIEEKSRFLFLTFPSSTSSSSCTRFEKRFNEEEIFEISLLASVVSLWNEVLVADIRHICEEVSFS